MRVRLTAFALVVLIVPTLALAHGGHKHVSGTVVSADQTAIVVKTSTGNVSVPLSSATRYYHGSSTKHPATANEVENGMRVVVHLGGDGKAAEVHIPEMKASEKVELHRDMLIAVLADSPIGSAMRAKRANVG